MSLDHNDPTIWQFASGLFAAILGILGIKKVRVMIDEKSNGSDTQDGSGKSSAITKLEYNTLKRQLWDETRADIQRIESKLETGFAQVRTEILALTKEVGALQGAISHLKDKG